MKNKYLIGVAIIVLVGGVAAYYCWPQTAPHPAPVSVPPAPPAPQPAAPAAPVVREEIEVPPTQPRLPALADSDKFVLDALAGLIGNKSLMQLFHTDRFIRNFVATIDNLPGRRAPWAVMPVEAAPGKFLVSGSADAPTVSASNAARYTPYVMIAARLDARNLVELYVRLYPLFQQAYEELGYPNKYFNDRLIVVLNDLLAAPIITEPVKLVQPNVLYQYAEPDLEGRSIGQRILMRLGNKNEAAVKAKLGEIKRELIRHMHQRKIESAR